MGEVGGGERVRWHFPGNGKLAGFDLLLFFYYYLKQFRDDGDT